MVESIQRGISTPRKAMFNLLQAALDKQKAEANDLAEKLVQYHILQHDAESNKQLYDGLLQKLKEAGITAGLRSSNIRVVDPALVPTAPSRPQKARNIMLALLVGLVGGIGLALFREYLDNTVKSPDDIEALTGLPSLAVVPSVPDLNGMQGRLARLSARWRRSPRHESARRVAFLHAAEVSNFRGFSRAANLSAAFAGRSSASGNPGDERAAARRKDDGGGEPGRHARAARRSYVDDGLRSAQAGHSPGFESDGRKRSGPQFLSRGRLRLWTK